MKTTNQKAARKIHKFQVCAYMPAGEAYPAICIQVSLPGHGAKFGNYLSPVIRRTDAGYMDVLKAAKGDVFWLYNTEPRTLL